MNGKSAFPALRVKTAVCLPSALMSVTRRDDRLGGGLRILAAVMVDGRDDVLGRYLPAVVVSNALAQLEGPGRGVRRCFPALGELADQRAVSSHFGQIVVVPMSHGDSEAVLVGRRVEAVVGPAVPLAHAHDTAFLGGAGEADGQGECGGASGAGLQESATGCSVHEATSMFILRRGCSALAGRVAGQFWAASTRADGSVAGVRGR